MAVSNAQKRISIERGNALTVQQLKDYLDTLDPSLEVAVLKRREDVTEDIYPPEFFRITTMSVDTSWEMLDLTIEKVL